MRTLYRAERVHTFGHPPTGDWVLVDGRHIERVGAGEPARADRVVDLPGATIVPGFVDSHVHLTSLGLSAENEDVGGLARLRLSHRAPRSAVARTEPSCSMDRCGSDWAIVAVAERRFEQNLDRER